MASHVYGFPGATFLPIDTSPPVLSGSQFWFIYEGLGEPTSIKAALETVWKRFEPTIWVTHAKPSLEVPFPHTHVLIQTGKRIQKSDASLYQLPALKLPLVYRLDKRNREAWSTAVRYATREDRSDVTLLSQLFPSLVQPVLTETFQSEFIQWMQEQTKPTALHSSLLNTFHPGVHPPTLKALWQWILQHHPNVVLFEHGVPDRHHLREQLKVHTDKAKVVLILVPASETFTGASWKNQSGLLESLRNGLFSRKRPQAVLLFSSHPMILGQLREKDTWNFRTVAGRGFYGQLTVPSAK